MGNGPLVVFFKPATRPGLRCRKEQRQRTLMWLVSHSFLLGPHLQEAFRSSWGSSGPLLQLHQVELLLPQHTCISALDNRERTVWRGAEAWGWLQVVAQQAPFLEDSQDQPLAGLGGTIHPRSIWASFLSLKGQAGSLVLKLCPRGILSPAKI